MSRRTLLWIKAKQSTIPVIGTRSAIEHLLVEVLAGLLVGGRVGDHGWSLNQRKCQMKFPELGW